MRSNFNKQIRIAFAALAFLSLLFTLFAFSAGTQPAEAHNTAGLASAPRSQKTEAEQEPNPCIEEEPEPVFLPLDVPLDADVQYMISDLSLTETIGFVDSVATTVLDPETGEYRPELFDFAFDAMVLMYFTNIALPADAGEQFDLVCHTNLCFEVKRNIDTEQLERLYAAADQKITHLLRCAENTLASKMTDLLASFEQLRECTSDVFSNVGGASLKAMVDRLAGMDEAVLAKAVLAHQGDADAQ